jgi:Tol biopolymer transport system component
VVSARPLGLWVVNRDGSGLTRLGTMAAFFPKYTPSGTQILFSQGGVWIINADGTLLKSITPETSSDINPVMSPDGRSIAFNRMINDGAEATLNIMDVTGVGVQGLAPSTRTYSTPAWSADGRRVAYVFGNAVRVINADGSNSGMLSSMVPSSVSSFAWRFDDKVLAYTGYTTCCTGDASIYTVDMTTGVRTRVTPAGTYTDLWPSWAVKH